MTAMLYRTCPDCGGSAASTVGQALDDRRLVWWEVFRCPHCDAVLEIDDAGVPEFSVRQAILRDEGLWGWHVSATGKPLVLALSAVRHRLGLTVAEVAGIKRRAPGVLAIGTRTEMEWLAVLATPSGIESAVVPWEPSPAAPLDLARFAETHIHKPPNAALLGREPVTVTREDFVPLERFRLTWRWTDPRFAVLPAEALEAIWSLSDRKAVEADRRASRFLERGSQSWPKRFDPELFATTEEFFYGDRRETVGAWLADRVGGGTDEVIVSWDRHTAAVTTAAVFARHWEEFCYPASDDVTVWPLSERWVLLGHHEEFFLFGFRRD